MIADKKFERIEHSAVKLSITVSGDGTRKAYDDVLRRYLRDVQLPGFRKGKVPRELLVRKFGDNIQFQAAADIIEESMEEALKDAEPEPISRPLIENIPTLKPEDPFDFSVTYDVFPEIVLGSYRGIRIEEPRVKITRKDEDAQLEIIRERSGVVVDKPDGTVSANSLVTMDYVELGDEDAPVEDTLRTGYVFTLGKDDHPYDIENEIEGMQVGDEKIIEKSIEVKLEDINAAGNGIAGGEADDNREAESLRRTVRLKVNITAVKEWDLPDLDDELAQDVSDDLKTLEELRDKVRKDLRKRADTRIREIKIEALTEKLLEDAVIDMPESLIRSEMAESWQRLINSSGVSREDFFKSLENTQFTRESVEERWRPNLTRKAKTKLIYGHIVTEERITVNDDELNDELEKRAENYGMPTEELEESLGGGHFRDYLRQDLEMNKLFDFLIDSASVKRGGKIAFESLMASAEGSGDE